MKISTTFIGGPTGPDGSGTAVFRVRLKYYNTKELCVLYEMSYWSMAASLKPLRKMLGKRRGYSYNVRQVEIIFRELGVPYSVNEDP